MKTFPPSSLAASGSPRVANSPFNNPKADVTFVTSDGVSFSVFKTILAVSSPFFDDMFALTQPDIKSSTHDPVSISEDSQTFDHLLRLCYPVRDPVISDVHDLGKVLEAALKYQMDEATEVSKTLLHQFVPANPLDVYAIACRLKLEDEARMAAIAWKSSRSFPDGGDFSATAAGAAYVPAMAHLSAGTYFRLIQFGAGARTAEQPFCDPPSPPREANAESNGDSTTIAPFVVPFIDDADVILKSSDGVDFPTHTLILRVAEAEGLLAGRDKNTPVRGSDLSVIPVDISSRILSLLLSLCYPLCSEPDYSGDIRTTCALIRTATRFNMTRVVTRMKDAIASLIPSHPLAIFFLAVGLGWSEEAEACCKHAVMANLDSTASYIPEMEDALAESYYKLLLYRHSCRSAALAVVATSAPFSTSWMTLQESLPELSQHLDRGAFLAIVDRELMKASEAATCPNPNVHNSGYSYNYNQRPTPEYVIDLPALARDSVGVVRAVQDRLVQIPLPSSLVAPIA